MHYVTVVDHIDVTGAVITTSNVIVESAIVVDAVLANMMLLLLITMLHDTNGYGENSTAADDVTSVAGAVIGRYAVIDTAADAMLLL